jgi:DNA-binding transcriptional LysR family regulator
VGFLKISIPPSLGLYLLSPLIAKFLKRYPEINLNVELETQIVDIIKEGYDLALRSAKLISSNLISQRIFTIKSVICGTKEYLKTSDVPKIPQDLINYNFATYSHLPQANQIKLIKNNETEVIYIQGNFTSNNLCLVKEMVLNHSCLAILPEFMVNNELQNKKLIQCLPSYQLPVHNLYAIYPEKEFLLPKVKGFIVMLKAFLEHLSF